MKNWAKRLFLVLGFLILIKNISLAQGNWVQQSSNTAMDLNCVAFFDEYTGIAAGNEGLIVPTSNCGNDWNPICIDPNQNDFKDICIFSDNNAIVVGSGGTVYKTKDRGQSWIKIEFNGEPFIVEFFNGTTGIILNKQDWGGTEVFKTTDAGESWFLLSVHEDFSINGSAKANDTTIYFAGLKINPPPNSQAAIFKLGLNDEAVTVVATPIMSYGFFDISFNNQGTGYAGGSGHSSISKDGGLTWENNLSWNMNVTLYSNIGLAASNNFIMKTTDAGENWTVDFNNQQDYINDIAFLNENIAIAVGLNGTILVNDNVMTGISNTINTPTGYKLNQNYPNPFNPSTKISFEIPAAGNVSLKVFDGAGRQVSTIINGNLNPGSYEYTFDAGNLSSGVYFYRLKTKDFAETRRMILVK